MLISTLTLFVPPTGPRLFHAFGLPLSLPYAASAELPSTPHHSYDAPLCCATLMACGVSPDSNVRGGVITRTP